ncbi:MAG: glycosyltransferase [Clostridiales bacterium]|nr:glycosyltransferase [Roseburia sp.]MDD7637590.1 glycosyltransferase [Clostridiales bacterium]MDY4112209.1 glycosyltransferase [Roseburia sp.]
MKIAMFTNNYKPYIGGVPISIEHLAEALRKRGHQVYVFAPSYEGQVEEPYVIRYPSFPITIVGAPVPNILTKLFIKKVKELQIDVIHVHHPAIVGNVALEIKRKLDIPVVFTYHTRYEEYLHYIAGLEKVEEHTGLLEKYLRYFCNRCDMLVAPTPGIREYLLQKKLQTPIAVLPTGIPAENFLPEQKKAEQIRQQYLGEADFLFCTVSRLAKEKNLYFQLEGLACLKRLLKKEGKTFCHMMIGGGPEKKELTRRIQELGLTENVFLLGNVDNAEIKNYQAASELFLFTSKSETQGIVLLEAMAVSNPVIAVEASGVRDVIKNGENGYLTEEDSYQWARKIAEVLKDAEQKEVMREGARKTAELYAEDTVAKRAEQCYAEVCERNLEEENRVSISQRYVV